MNSNDVGNFIKKLREEKGWTQEDLAQKIPIGRGAVSKWERGVTLPDISVLTCLSKVFNVSTDELLAGERNTSINVALELYKDRNKNRKYYKVSIIIIISLIFLFLSYYFINQYKSVKVYTISGNFEIKNGIFLVTNEKVYFNLGEITNKINKDITTIELYYYDDSEILVSSTNSESLLIYDTNGYNEFFDFTILNKIMKNLYIKVYYEDTFDKITLSLKKDYVNDNILFFDNSKISNQSFKSKANKIYDFKKYINAIKIKYTKNNDAYFFEINKNNKNIKLKYLMDTQILNVLVSQNDIVQEEYIYDLTNELIDYRNTNNNQDQFVSLNLKCECILNNCNSYDFSSVCSNLENMILDSIE